MTTSTGLQNYHVGMTSAPVVAMLTPDREAETVGKSRAAVSRARRDPQHPACRSTPGGPTRDSRCDTETIPGGGGDRVVTRAPEDAIRAFWATRRRGPKPRATTPQEQQ